MTHKDAAFPLTRPIAGAYPSVVSPAHTIRRATIGGAVAPAARMTIGGRGCPAR
jgi:hypothetical protein